MPFGLFENPKSFASFVRKSVNAGRCSGKGRNGRFDHRGSAEKTAAVPTWQETLPPGVGEVT